MSTSPKLRITKSLLDSWLWAFKREDGWDDFLSTLHREKKPPTQAMLDGTRFENVLNNVLKGEAIPADHEWASVITEMSKDLQGSQQQVVLFSDCEVNGQPFLLHGVLDYLLAGSIWDCKFTKNYHLNKYFWEGTSQTAMYFALVPEARDFTYIISDGNGHLNTFCIFFGNRYRKNAVFFTQIGSMYKINNGIVYSVCQIASLNQILLPFIVCATR